MCGCLLDTLQRASNFYVISPLHVVFGFFYFLREYFFTKVNFYVISD